MLQVKSIEKTFEKGNINEIKVIDDITLHLTEGEFVTVIGSNGAGKSTLLNCIAGVHSVDSGGIQLNSAEISSMTEHKRAKHIGRVFQDPLKGTAFNMSIEENMAIAYAKCETKGLKPGINKDDLEFFMSQLELLGMGLEEKMHQKVGLLSGGQRQAITLLMATMTKPKLLLLDEHTAALDPVIAKKVLQITDEIVKKQNICTIMITHNMKDALAYGTRTIMMHKGKIILDIQGKERDEMTVEKLIQQFAHNSDEEIYNDRMLL